MERRIYNYKAPPQNLPNEKLRDFFIDHLNRIFCAESHLQERLLELAEQDDFNDLKHPIIQTIAEIDRQLSRTEEVFILLNAVPSVDGCEELVIFIESGFSQIYYNKQDPVTRDLSLLFYLAVIESIESASFRVLELNGVQFEDTRIGQLLTANANESKTGRSLALLITTQRLVTG